MLFVWSVLVVFLEVVASVGFTQSYYLFLAVVS